MRKWKKEFCQRIWEAMNRLCPPELTCGLPSCFVTSGWSCICVIEIIALVQIPGHSATCFQDELEVCRSFNAFHGMQPFLPPRRCELGAFGNRECGIPRLEYSQGSSGSRDQSQQPLTGAVYSVAEKMFLLRVDLYERADLSRFDV